MHKFTATYSCLHIYIFIYISDSYLAFQFYTNTLFSKNKNYPHHIPGLIYNYIINLNSYIYLYILSHIQFCPSLERESKVWRDGVRGSKKECQGKWGRRWEREGGNLTWHWTPPMLRNSSLVYYSTTQICSVYLLMYPPLFRLYLICPAEIQTSFTSIIDIIIY